MSFTKLSWSKWYFIEIKKTNIDLLIYIHFFLYLPSEHWFFDHLFNAKIALSRDRLLIENLNYSLESGSVYLLIHFHSHPPLTHLTGFFFSLTVYHIFFLMGSRSSPSSFDAILSASFCQFFRQTTLYNYKAQPGNIACNLPPVRSPWRHNTCIYSFGGHSRIISWCYVIPFETKPFEPRSLLYQRGLRFFNRKQCPQVIKETTT